MEPRFKLKGHEQEVVDLYIRGKSTIEIGKIFNVSATSVYQCLGKMNTPRRENGGYPLIRTHCKKGHPWIEENIFTNSQGCKVCRICQRIHSTESSRRMREKNPEANREYHRLWAAKQRRENADRLKGYNIRKDYGMSLEEYKSKLEQQQGKCAICDKYMVRPCIDHDHKTQQVRDLLCNSCNSALGFLFEDVVIVDSALSYLKKWKSCPA